MYFAARQIVRQIVHSRELADETEATIRSAYGYHEKLTYPWSEATPKNASACTPRPLNDVRL